MPSVTTRVTRRAEYMRVSTDDQAEALTIRNQARKLGRRLGSDYDDGTAVLVGRFTDDGVSGTIPLLDRPGGRDLAALIMAGEVDEVCVTRVDRLGRDTQVLLAIAHLVNGHGARIHSLSENVDLTTSSGVFQFTVMGALGQLERESIRDRFLDGRSTATEDGKFLSGPIPFGYDVVGQRLVPSERLVDALGITEAELVVEIFERIAAGQSGIKVVDWLRSLGVPSEKRYWNARRDGKVIAYPLWQHSRVRAILHNPLYYGERLFKYRTHGPAGMKTESAPQRQTVPPLVTKDLWDRAGASMRGHHSNYNVGQPSRHVYLLSGIARCAACGHKLVGNMRGQGPRHRRSFFYYACSGAKSGRNAAAGRPCASPAYPQGTDLETMICEAIDAAVADPDRITDALREQAQQRHGQVAQQQDRVRVLRSQMAALEKGKAALTRALGRDDLTEAEFAAAIHEHNAEMAGLRSELEVMSSRETLAGLISEQIDQAHATLEMLQREWPAARAEDDRPALRELVKGAVQDVTCARGGRVDYTLCFNRLSSDSRQTWDYLQIGSYSFLIGDPIRRPQPTLQESLDPVA